MMNEIDTDRNTDERLLLKLPAKPVPVLGDDQSKQHSGSLSLDYTSHLSASFISQRSSSLESCESPFLTGPRSSLSNKDTGRQNGRPALEAESEDSTFVNNDLSALTGDLEDVTHNSQTLNGVASLEPTFHHPDHQSTPTRDCSYFLPNVPLSEEQHFSLSMDGLAEVGRQEEGEAGKIIFKPGDLVTPIMGFEMMESRSKFTVFKIRVQKKISDDSPDSWFVFRRYSDFVHLNDRLKYQFPCFRLALPPKRWFRDNFDRNFLEDRVLGLQAFLDNIIGHNDLCNSDAVRAFFCIDEPPGPHDSLEESRALCESLEESMYTLRQQLKEKESEITLLREELDLYKSQVCLLTDQLKVINSRSHSSDVTSPSSSGTGYSLAECDRVSPISPVSAAEEKEFSGS